MNERPGTGPGASPPGDNHTLPAWVYNDARFFELERTTVFAFSWHLGCHVSELAAPGDYVTLKVSGERAIIARLARIASYQTQWRSDLAKFDRALQGLDG